jgi:hypothetical protein
MAYFDVKQRKEIIDYLESLGLDVVFFDNRSSTYIEKLIGENQVNRFIETPIKVVSRDSGQEYDIFYRNSTTTYFKMISKNERGDLQMQSGRGEIFIEKKGKKTIFSEEIVIDDDLMDDEYQESINEFTNLPDFSSLESPDYSVIYGTNPQVSVAQPILNIDEITDVQLENSKKLLDKEKEIWLETKQADNKGILNTAMWTFDEIDNLYNSKITADDKRAYFIYLQNRARKKLKGDWSEKFGSSYPAEAVDILELMKKGRLFLDLSAKRGERLQPRVIFRSGNIWKKYTTLTNRKTEYVRRFGDEIYNLHLKEIEDIYKIVKEERLRVSGPDVKMYLKITPVSEFAKSVFVSEVINPANRDWIQKNWDVYISSDKGDIKEDVVNLSGGSQSSSFITKKSLKLVDAFIQWCKDAGDGKEALNNGVQWSAQTTNYRVLVERYIKPVKNPYGKKGVDRWQREKDDAKKVGERLFTQFLRDGLPSGEQQKVEVIWNSTFNAYKEPKLDEVPIGFTYKKYLDGKYLFLLKKHNLNALRYYLTRGTAGLAYGVGIGKTFCSIFVLKQALDLGLAERPLVIVPNQVYPQFQNEIYRALGSEYNPKIENSKLNGFFNGSGEYWSSKANNAVNGINICTYEATPRMIFSTDIKEDWIDNAINVLEMGTEEANPVERQEWYDEHSFSIFGIEKDKPSKKKGEEDDDSSEDDFVTDAEIDELIDSETTFDEDVDLGGYSTGGKLETEVGKEDNKIKERKIVSPIFINSPKTSFDFICVDEAHNFNNLYTQVIAPPRTLSENEIMEREKKGKTGTMRQRNPYSSIRETSGGKSASAMAEKLFWLTQYVQSKNKFGNTILLSATPFTNSPLQVYSMMTFLGYETLRDLRMSYISEFFDIFAKIEYADDIGTTLQIVRRNKFIGWINAIALQKLVYRYFDKSTREEEDEVADRPQKIVLPLKRMLINGVERSLKKENHISTTIRMSDFQLELWQRVKDFAEGKLPYSDLFNEDTINTTIWGKYKPPKPKKEKSESDEDSDAEIEIENPDELTDGTDEGEKTSAFTRRLMSVTYGRQICLNPYLFKGSGYKVNPTPKQYVEASPKLLYVMKCIETVKKYHEQSEVSPYMSGQIIYMNYGVETFPMIRDYMVETLGFNVDEIGIISGSTNMIGKKRQPSKKQVQDAFLGKSIDTLTGVETALPENKRVKILLGSESIKEGINLQDRASVLYNCFLDWNPTDRIQLEGRIWRQGNEFANVRIVTPLVADCIDVFMFQKIEDKTERINQIWTRNGQIQELDTTSFDPAELKYELLTDPVALAMLEVENKKEKLEEQKVDASVVLSEYINLENIWNKGEKAIYPSIASRASQDYRGYIYYAIRQIRPDLIDKPLLNKDNFYKWVSSIAENYKGSGGNYRLLERIKSDDTFTIYEFLDNFSGFLELDNPYYFSRTEYYKNQKEISIVNSFFNYTSEELTDLMVKALKDQKIAYPLGYSKNWKEVIQSKKPTPFIDGDEVEFDTKSGRKKGKAENVKGKLGYAILGTFYNEIDTYNGEELRKFIKENKLDESILEKVEKIAFDKLTAKDKEQLIKLYKTIWAKGLDTEIGKEMQRSYDNYYMPNKLDIGDFEDIDVISRNVVSVAGKKVVEPTKYPEPFVYTNKDAENNVIDITLYLYETYQDSWKKLKAGLSSDEISYSRNNLFAPQLYLQPTEQIPMYTQKLGTIFEILTMYSNADYNFRQTYDDKEQVDKIAETMWSKEWITLEEKWKDNKSQGLFKDMFNFQIPKNIVDFNVAKEKKFATYGIKNRTDLDDLVKSQKELLSTIELNYTQLSDKQVFEEIVQEVTRTQKELFADELRAGSSFVARSEAFARCNEEYLGNEMLAIYNNNPRKDTITCGHVYTEEDKPKELDKRVERVVEVVTEVPAKTTETAEEKLNKINEKLDAILGLLEIYEEGEPKYIAIQEKINALNELKEIYE